MRFSATLVAIGITLVTCVSAYADQSCVATCGTPPGDRSGSITMWIGDNPGACGAGCQFVPEVGMMFTIVGYGGGGEGTGCTLGAGDCCLHAKLCDAWVNSVDCGDIQQNQTWCWREAPPIGCLADTTPWFEVAADRTGVLDHTPYVCGEQFEIVQVNSSSFPYCIEVVAAECNSWSK